MHAVQSAFEQIVSILHCRLRHFHRYPGPLIVDRVKEAIPRLQRKIQELQRIRETFLMEPTPS